MTVLGDRGTLCISFITQTLLVGHEKYMANIVSKLDCSQINGRCVEMDQELSICKSYRFFRNLSRKKFTVLTVFDAWQMHVYKTFISLF